MPGFNNGVCFGENGFDFTGADGSTATNALGGSNSGVTNRITVQNTSNTASSQAAFLATVGGATAGDPFETFTVTGAQSFSIGVDNSDSDMFKISNSTVLGTNDRLLMQPTGETVINIGASVLSVTAFQVSSNIDGEREILISNSSNTTNAKATFTASVAGTSAGDPQIKFLITGGGQWSQGADNSDSDSFVLSPNNGLGTGNVSRFSSAGSLSLPLQPRFQARLSATVSNATGDGTGVVIPFNVTNFDNRSAFNTTTGVFTAPETQSYMFTGCITVLNLVAASLATISVITTQNNFLAIDSLVGILRDASNNYVLSFSVGPTLMSAGDTASIGLTISGGAKTVGILGGTISSSASSFMGAALS